MTRWPVDLFEKEPLKGKWEVNLHTPTKFGEDPSKDLGVHREQTNTQTNAARIIVWLLLWLPKVPSQYHSNRPGNLGNLGSHKEIQPQYRWGYTDTAYLQYKIQIEDCVFFFPLCIEVFANMFCAISSSCACIWALDGTTLSLHTYSFSLYLHTSTVTWLITSQLPV